MKTSLAIITFATFLAVKGSCQPMISVNFAGGGAVGGTPTPLAATDAAGVVVATNWNNIAQNLATGTASSLFDNSGKLTSAGVTWSSDDTWSTLISQTGPNFKLMKGYLDNPSHDIVIDASGVPYANYSVYVYFNDDNTGSGTVGSYSIGNTKIYGKDAGALFNGVFTQATGTNATDTNAVGNYVVFQGLSGSSFTLTAHSENLRSPVNGLQIVANSLGGVTGVTKIGAGEDQSLFLRSDGSLWSVGYNYRGELGDGVFDTDSPYGTNTPQEVVASNVVAVTGGVQHSLFLESSGSLWDMGYNYYGQLGDGTVNATNLPEQIVNSNVMAVAAGGEHSLFLKSDGTLWGMGYNGLGQLGDGTYNNTNRPEQIPASNVVTVAAGAYDSFFLESGGSLWAMGYDYDGELGDGTYKTNSPFAVNRPEEIVASNVLAVTTGDAHSLFLKSDGSLWAMGFNYYGQLGDGTDNMTNRPEQIVASNVVAIAAGDYHSIFLKSDGSLWGMGFNDDGELGDGTYNPTNRPEQIVASNVMAIAAGGDFSLFLKSDGSLWGMGGNDFGQLGNFYTNTALPVQIFPCVQVSANPTNGPQPLSVQFTSSGTDINGNPIVSWKWNFGDGSTGSTQNPSHLYNTNGIFYSSVIASNSLGARVAGYGPPIFITPPAPANDNFADATVIAGTSATVFGSNTNATKEPGEPDHDGNPGGASVWWSWTAPDSGSVTLDTYGSSFDTLLAVYTGISVSNLDEVNYTGTGSEGLGIDEVNFNATAGTQYFIAVDGYNGGSGPEEGNIELSLDECVPPSDISITSDGQETESDGIHLFFMANVGVGTAPFSFIWNPPTSADLVTNYNLGNGEYEVVLDRTNASESVSLSVTVFNACGGGGGSGSGTACGTCLSPDEPNLLAAGVGAGTGPTKTNLCGITSVNTRWYEMQAGDSGPITVGTVGSSNLNQMAVYSGISFASLTYLGCTTNRPARITFNATSNAVYYFALDPGTNNASNLGLTYGYEPPIENYTLTKGTFALQSGVAPPLAYQVLASTNLTLNVSNWSVVLTTNWSLSNSNYFNYRLNYVETNLNKFPRRFYRLAP